MKTFKLSVISLLSINASQLKSAYCSLDCSHLEKFFKHIFEMGVNMKLDFSWDFAFYSGTFYRSANYDYHLCLNKKCWRKTCNHNFRPLKLFSAWYSRISTVFNGNISLDLSDKFYSEYLWFYESLTRFLMLVRSSCF